MPELTAAYRASVLHPCSGRNSPGVVERVSAHSQNSHPRTGRCSLSVSLVSHCYYQKLTPLSPSLLKVGCTGTSRTPTSKDIFPASPPERDIAVLRSFVSCHHPLYCNPVIPLCRSILVYRLANRSVTRTNRFLCGTHTGKHFSRFHVFDSCSFFALGSWCCRLYGRKRIR